MAGARSPSTDGFHNPYNFVPAPPRKPDHAELGDHAPAGHHRYLEDRYSGRLTVELTTETPLLLPDTARLQEEKDGTAAGHKTFPVLCDPRCPQKPYLSPTAVRGMLRAAYEAVTNSRFGVFRGHEDRLAYRMDARDGLAMVPARVENGALTLLMGATPSLPRYAERNGRMQWIVDGAMYAAWLKSYPTRRYKGIKPKHRQKVSFWALRKTHTNPTFVYWQVLHVVPFGEAQPPRPHQNARWFDEGWACVTGRNIGRKHDERIFFHDPGTPKQQPLPLSDDWKRKWENLIRDYRREHEPALKARKKKGQKPSDWLGRNVGETAYSIHVYCDRETKLENGSLCYILYDHQGRPVGPFPVIISRVLHRNSPLDLLPASLRPARTIGELSPADRVFGWVGQEGSSRTGPTAWRGSLRIGATDCLGDDAVEDFGNTPVPLAILSQPKPQQARFYLARDEAGTPLADGAPKAQIGYGEGRSLRGRKVYPHHRDLPTDYWKDPVSHDATEPVSSGEPAFYREYLRAGRTRDRQNRSIKGWVKPKTTFRFDIQLGNLSEVELGALLWLLTPDETGPQFFRLGGGKPLGFGSASLRLAAHELRSGKEMRERYRSLGAGGAVLTDDDRAAAVAAFKRAVESSAEDAGGTAPAFDQVPFIAAFLAAARGHDDGLPVRYPRLKPAGSAAGAGVPPDPNGENFKWFGENERGQKRALPALTDACALMHYTARDGGQNR